MGTGHRVSDAVAANVARDPYAQLPAKPRGKRVRLRYGLFRALLLVALIALPALLDPLAREAALHPRQAAAAAVARVNRLPAQGARHQAAPPSPSGAYPPYPRNHTLDADPIALGRFPNADFETPGYAVGTPPTNSALDTAPYQVGSPPTNFDFASGDFAGWITAGSGVSIQTTGGPDGAWAQLNGTNAAITSDAFTVDAAAQVALFDFGALTTSGSASVTVYALSGSGYTTSTTLRGFSCSACNSWAAQTVALEAFLGQSIKLKFIRMTGTVGLDRVRPAVVADGFATTGTVNRVLDGGNPYLALVDGNATTGPIAIDASAQLLTLRMTGLTTGSDQLSVDVLSGAGFGTVTSNVILATLADAWTAYRINLAGWLGQTIELRFRLFSGDAGLDDVGVQRVDFPGWTLGGITTAVAGDGGGTAASGGTLTSDPVTLPAEIQQLSLRYRMASSGAGLYFELLRGAGYGTVVTLGNGPLGGATGQWLTFKAAVNAYAGERVRFRIRPQLGAVTVDNVALFEQAVPGWRFTGGSAAVASGSDANGTYLTSWASGGAIQLEGSPLDVGLLDRPNRVDGRSYVISYAIGYQTGSLIRVEWVPEVGNAVVVYQDAADTPTGFRNGRFTLWDTQPTRGRVWINVTGGGKLYAIADNAARQQLAEPFSQQIAFAAGTTIDAATGSFGTSATDLAIQGGPLPLVLTRYYAGHSDRFGELGFRWATSFDAFAATYANGDVAVVFPAGREEYFAWNASTSSFAAVDPRVTSTLATVTSAGGSTNYAHTTKEGLVTTFAANSAGDLISIRDRNGNQLTVYRSPTTGLVTSVADDAGRALTFAYDANGRLASVTDPAGGSVSYGYDGNGDLVSVERTITAGGTPARTEYAYSRHRLIQITERQGDATTNGMVTVLTMTLDAYNRVTEATDAAGNSVRIAYQSPSNGVTQVTDALGNATAYYFDDHARTTHVVAPNGDVSQWLYDTAGRLQSTVDPATNAYQVAYNTSNEPSGLTDPLGHGMGVDWDAVKHLPTQVVDPRGATTVNTYDAAGNLIQTVVDSSKDALGNPIAGTHLDLMTVYTVDAKGLRTSEDVDPLTDAAGATRTGSHLDLLTKYSYDAAGNQTGKIVDPSTDAAGNPRTGSHLDLTWAWTYDDAGRVLTATDPNGHTTTTHYDIIGRKDKVTDALGGETRIYWDLSGNVVQITTPDGHRQQWSYDENNHPIQRKDQADKLWNATYDANGRKATETDPLGHVTAYEYDERGRVSKRTVDPGSAPHLNLVTTYQYDGNGNVTEEMIDPGSAPHLALTTAYTYDASNHLLATTMPNGGVRTYAYDANGNRTAETDPLSNTTTYAYDAANRLIGVTDPLGHAVTYGYDAAGRRTSATDALGQVTTTVYDAAGRVVQTVVDPGSSPHLNVTTNYTHDGAGNTTSVQDPAGQYTWYEYDALDRLVEITDPLSRVTSFAYDANGRRTQTTAPSGRVTTVAYDARGLLVSETVDAGAAPHLNLTTSYAYDDAGRRITKTNPRGYDTGYAYDAGGRLASVTDALGGTVAFAYDAAGRQTSVTNARGKTTLYAYDALGNVTGVTDPLSRTQNTTYDLAGNVASETDARGITATYAYDAAGRLTAITPPSPNVGISYSYDDANRQIGMTDATGTTGWTYDAADRVTQVASPQGTEAYGYDAAGRRTSLTLPGSQTVTYAYDAAGQELSQTDWQSNTTSYTYDADGNVATETLPNGVVTTSTYDTAGRLASVASADGTATLQAFAYTLDANGNRTAVAISGTVMTSGTESYVYDALDRLIEAVYVDGLDVVYTYDANGNRTSQDDGATTTTYGFDDADQLLTVNGSVAYAYDASGNRTGAGSDTFQYDWRGRLAEANVSGVTTDYAYAGDDRRVGATQGSTTTDYLWDREGGLPTLTSDGTTTYVHGPAGIASETGASATNYPLRDGLGTPRTRVDDTGVVTATADYDAWGNLRASSGSNGVFGWTGEQTDPSTGMMNLRARDYSPGTARFTSRDTVQPNGPGTQGWNPYAYAGNNPATHTDPSGHISAGSYETEGEVSYTLDMKRAGGALSMGTAMAFAVQVLQPALVSAVLGVTATPVMAFLLLALFFTVVLLVLDYVIWCVFQGPCGDAIRSGLDFDITSTAKATWHTLTEAGRTVVTTWVSAQGNCGSPNPQSDSLVTCAPEDKCPAPTAIYHRLWNGTTQTDETALLQQSSGEIWGNIPQQGAFPAVQAFPGPLPDGKPGIEFKTGVPYDAKTPAMVYWRTAKQGVRIEGDTAKLYCVVVTKVVLHGD